jgi:hypothetical protein
MRRPLGQGDLDVLGAQQAENQPVVCVVVFRQGDAGAQVVAVDGREQVPGL